MGEAARKKKEQQGEPQSGVAERPQQIEACDIKRERDEHHIAHVACPCRADEHAVEFISERARKRGQRGEQQIIAGICPHLWFSRKKIDERIGLLVGDMRLSEIEDKLSDAWPKCYKSATTN